MTCFERWTVIVSPPTKCCYSFSSFCHKNSNIEHLAFNIMSLENCSSFHDINTSKEHSSTQFLLHNDQCIKPWTTWFVGWLPSIKQNYTPRNSIRRLSNWKIFKNVSQQYSTMKRKKRLSTNIHNISKMSCFHK